MSVYYTCSSKNIDNGWKVDFAFTGSNNEQSCSENRVRVVWVPVLTDATNQCDVQHDVRGEQVPEKYMKCNTSFSFTLTSSWYASECFLQLKK